MREFIFVAIALLVMGCSDESGKEHMEERLAVGQIWSYQTRPAEPMSRITICAIEENEKLGQIVHISIDGLSMASPTSPTGKAENIQHLPYSGDSLRASLRGIVETSVPSDEYKEGYAIWKEAFDKGEAGVFTIPVSDAIDFMEGAMNK